MRRILVIIFFCTLLKCLMALRRPEEHESALKRHLWWDIVDKAVNKLEGKVLLGSEKATVHWKHANEIVENRIKKERKLEKQREDISKLRMQMKGHRRRIKEPKTEGKMLNRKQRSLARRKKQSQ